MCHSPKARKFASGNYTLFLAVMTATVLLFLVTYSECRSLKDNSKGKGKKFLADDCDPLHCNGGSGCKNVTEICKERIIYGDILVCQCIHYKLADEPIYMDLGGNVF